MPALQVFQYAVLTDSAGNRQTVGSMVDPVNLTADFEGTVERRVFEVAASGIKLLFDADDSPNTAFSFLWIKADADDVRLELRVDADGNVSTAYQTHVLKKNLAFVLGSDDAYAGDYTAGFGAGTLSVIDEIRVLNSGSETATVEVITAR